MATVLNRTTKELRRSVNTPDYDEAGWIIDPDLTQVEGFPAKYWIIESGDIITLADTATQAAIDAALETVRITAEKESEKTRLDNERVLVALGHILVDEFNQLRQLHSLPDRTFAQLVAAIKGEIDNG